MAENEQCKDDPSVNYYTSQRKEILNNMGSEKQKEQDAKLFMEKQREILKEKIKICLEREKENEAIKEKLEKQVELRNEIVKKLTSANEVMNNNVENFNLLRTLMQLCINGQQQSDELKQDVLDNFKNLKQKYVDKEKAYIQKLSKMSEYRKNCKQQHLETVEYLEIQTNKIQEDILKKKQNILNMQNQIKCNKEYAGKLNQEINKTTEEQNDMFEKFSELQVMVKESTAKKDRVESEYNKKLSDSKIAFMNMKDEFSELERKYDDFQKSLNSRNEFLNELNNQKVFVEETILNLKIKCTETEKELCGVKIQLQKEREDYDSEINTLKEQIEELEKNNTLLNEENKVFEKEFSELNIEEIGLNNEINDFKIYSKQLGTELKQEQDILEEQFDKFQSEISTLKIILDKENQDEIVNDEVQQKLQVKLDELNEEYALANLQSDVISAEAEADEITINLNIDSWKNEINKVKLEIQEKQSEIRKHISAGTETLERVDDEFDEKMKKLGAEYKGIKNELNERYENDQKCKSDELKILREDKISLELYTSELRLSTENLQNQVELKKSELGKLHEELIKNTTDTFSLKNAQNLNTSKYDFKVPKYKIPTSKYSSTSDSSGDGIALIKRRKSSVQQRRTMAKKSVPPQKSLGNYSQKSIDDVFEALKYCSGSENRSARKRSIKKPVF